MSEISILKLNHCNVLLVCSPISAWDNIMKICLRLFVYCAQNSTSVDDIQFWLFQYGPFLSLNNQPGMLYMVLTHWGRVTHICFGELTIIGSDNGLMPERRQANIWTNAGILLIGTLGTNFREILIGIQTFSFKKMHLKMSSGKLRPFVSASMS